MAKSLVATFAQFPAPRSVHGRRHPPAAILTLAVAGMLSGARSLPALWPGGRLQPLEALEAMGFTREKTPAVSTLHRVFSARDASVFEAALAAWVQAFLPHNANAIALDGKPLRGLHGEEWLGAASRCQTAPLVGARPRVDREPPPSCARRDLCQT